jgi:hypothetical protein
MECFMEDNKEPLLTLFKTPTGYRIEFTGNDTSVIETPDLKTALQVAKKLLDASNVSETQDSK